ncbi:MAG TPA: 30S ribosomal protein S6 [Solirubrobacterales bacterium]
MAAPREYELVLMLDPQQDAPARDALAQQARGQIEATGSLKQENTWGLRKMAYEINRRTEADYRWFRFEAPTELLDTLDHELKIADGVLRFRIFKVDPNTPSIVPPAVAAPGPRERTGGPGDRGPRDDRSGDRDDRHGDREDRPVEREDSTVEPAAEPAGE